MKIYSTNIVNGEGNVNARQDSSKREREGKNKNKKEKNIFMETLILTCDEREKLRYHRGYEKLSDMVVNLVYLDRHTRSSPIAHPRIRAGIPGDFVRRGRSYQRAPASSNLRKGKESPLSRPFFLLPLRPETRTISSNICHSLRVTTSLHLS